MTTETMIPVTNNVAYDATSALTYGRQAKAMQDATAGLVIDSTDMLEMAAEDLRKVKQLQKDVEAARTSITGPLNQALSAVNALFRQPAEYLAGAERTLKVCIGTYQEEQRRIAAQAAAEAARRQAKEQARQAEIAQQAEEAVRLLRQQAMETDDQEQLSLLVRQAEEQSFAAEAAAQLAQVVVSAPVAVAPAKVSGISGRQVYSAEVTDLRALLQAVLDGKAPLEAVQADMKFLGAQAKAFKKTGPLFPGVVATATNSISARA